jgi:hypothetical protein
MNMERMMRMRAGGWWNLIRYRHFGSFSLSLVTCYENHKLMSKIIYQKSDSKVKCTAFCLIWPEYHLFNLLSF